MKGDCDALVKKKIGELNGWIWLFECYLTSCTGISFSSQIKGFHNIPCRGFKNFRKEFFIQFDAAEDKKSLNGYLKFWRNILSSGMVPLSSVMGLLSSERTRCQQTHVREICNCDISVINAVNGRMKNRPVKHKAENAFKVIGTQNYILFREIIALEILSIQMLVTLPLF